MWSPFTNNHPAAEQAASELHAKRAKLQTAHDAVLIDDMAKLAATERAVVNQYRANKVFGGKDPANPESGELIVADDVQINQGATWKTIAAVAIPAAAALLGYEWLNQPTAADAGPAPAAATGPADADTRYRITPVPGD